MRLSWRYKQVLKEIKPDVILLHEGNVFHLGEMYIRLARKHGIPSLILPYTICTQIEPAEAILSSDLKMPCTKFPFSELVKRWFPQWIYSYKDKEIVRLPVVQILVLECLGIAPPLPWVQESCSADVILVENEKNHQHYLKEGISDAQMRIVGNVNHDIFYAQRANKNSERTKMNEALGFAEDLPIIAVSVQPNCFGMRPDKADYNGFDDALTHWCEVIQRIPDYNIILVPHPSIGTEVYAYENERIRVSKVNTAYLLPLADFYVASISATIKWAIACGIPVINYDYYRFHYDDYENAPGVFNCYDKAVFEAEIDRIAANPQNAIAELTAAMAPHVEEWGKMDGKFHERFDGLLCES